MSNQTNIPAFSLYINGAFVPAESGQTIETFNPANGEVLATIAAGSAKDIDKAVQAARKAFEQGPWPKMSPQERASVLRKMAEVLEANGKTLIDWLVKESGSTVRKAKGEVWLAGKHLAYFADLAEKQADEEIQALSKPGVSQNLLTREPIGVCGQITPWNFPLQMPIWKIGPALVAGNTVVLKPAEETSAIVMVLMQLFQDCGLPPGVLNVVTGLGEEAGAALSQHPGVDKIAFTGSTEIGKKVMQDASQTLKKVTLELGGKSANIVFDDADLSQAVDAALYAAFFHSGQCCTAGTRLLVQKGIYDTFVAELKEKASRMQLGSPADKATDMGPLVSKKQQERVLAYIETGKKEGATCLIGGALPQTVDLKSGCYVQPTIFTDVKNSMTIAQEEIFDPVLCVIPFETEEQAIQIANDSVYGLAGAVWSQNEARALSVARQLRAGTVWVNEYHLISEKAPFGGYKQSGIGRELGEHALDEYTELKHIHIDQIGNREKKFWYDSVLATPAPVAQA